MRTSTLWQVRRPSFLLNTKHVGQQVVQSSCAEGRRETLFEHRDVLRCVALVQSGSRSVVINPKGVDQASMSAASDALVEWIVSADNTRSVLIINFCQEGHEGLWQHAKRACHELLNLPQGIKHYAVNVTDINEDMSRFSPDVTCKLRNGLCTLFEIKHEKIGKIVGIGKGYNNLVKEKAGAVAMLTTALLVDKAKKTHFVRTVHKQVCCTML